MIPINAIRSNAHKFIQNYADAHKENAEAQSFLNDFFEIFGISRRRVATFEEPVKIEDGTKRIDLLWPGVLLVEMKSKGKDLTSAYTQGLGYLGGLPDEKLPQFIMVCDLETFRLHELDIENSEVHEFKLSELLENLHHFDFMLGKKAQNISEYELNEQAAILLGTLHDSLEESGYTG